MNNGPKRVERVTEIITDLSRRIKIAERRLDSIKTGQTSTSPVTIEHGGARRIIIRGETFYADPTGIAQFKTINLTPADLSNTSFDLIKLPNATATPTVAWDQSSSVFTFSKGLLSTGTITAHAYSSSTVNIETVSGTYTATKMIYKFSEARGWGYNDADDSIYYGANTTVPFILRKDSLMVGNLLTAPDSFLHVHKASAGGVTAQTNTVATFENSTDAFLSILIPDNQDGGIYIGTPSDNDSCRIYYDLDASNQPKIQFWAQGAKQMTLGSGSTRGLWLGVDPGDSMGHFHSGSAGAVTAVGNTVITAENSGDAYLSILTTAVNAGAIIFGSPSDNAKSYVLYDHSLEEFRIYPGGSGAQLLYLKAGGLWLGTSAGDAKLHIFKASAGSVTALADTVGVLENNSHAYFSILSPATATGAILFGSPTSNNRANIAFDHNVDIMSFRVGGATRTYIDALGNFGVGGTIWGTSAERVLSLKTGVAPSTGPADTVQLFSLDLSAGNTMLGIRTEGTATGSGTPAQNRTMAISINGTTYYVLMSTAAS